MIIRLRGKKERKKKKKILKNEKDIQSMLVVKKQKLNEMYFTIQHFYINDHINEIKDPKLTFSDVPFSSFPFLENPLSYL
jgi:hypothetical protein